MQIIKHLITISFLTFSCNVAFADYLQPVFSGFYTDTDNFQHAVTRNIQIDLKNIGDKPTTEINEYIQKNSYEYVVKINGEKESLQTYAQQYNPKPLFSWEKQKKYDRCVYNNIQSASYVDTNNISYVNYPGTVTDYSRNILITPVYYATYECFFKKEGKNYSDSNVLLFLPIYYCPKGYTSVGVMKGCVANKEVVAPGDIVGRDLAINSNYIPNFIKKQGHVGLFITDKNQFNNQYYSNIAEVLGENGGEVYFGSMQEFKDKVQGGYWGARYGISRSEQNLTVSQFLNMVSLINYIDEGGVDYTFSWHYSIRHSATKYFYNPYSLKADPFEAKYPSIFRCDTFVKYVYENGAGHSFNLTSNISPKYLYQSLLYQRSSDISYGLNKEPSLLSSSNESEFKCEGSFEEIKHNLLENIHIKDATELKKFDACIMSIRDASADEIAKSEFLWSIYKDNRKNLVARSFLLDALQNYQNFRLINEYLNEYNDSSSDIDLRARMSSILMNNIIFNSPDDIKRLTLDDIVSIKKIYKLFDLYGSSQHLKFTQLSLARSKLAKYYKLQS